MDACLEINCFICIKKYLFKKWNYVTWAPLKLCIRTLHFLSNLTTLTNLPLSYLNFLRFQAWKLVKSFSVFFFTWRRGPTSFKVKHFQFYIEGMLFTVPFKTTFPLHLELKICDYEESRPLCLYPYLFQSCNVAMQFEISLWMLLTIILIDY